MKNPALLYEVSFFSALLMVFPESWKRSCPNFYAHDCTYHVRANFQILVIFIFSMYVRLKDYYLNIIENFGLYSPTYFQSIYKNYIFAPLFFIFFPRNDTDSKGNFDEHPSLKFK